MAKGQKRSGREPKKPKKSKAAAKGAASASTLLPPSRPAPKAGTK
jgi:hypothetical protein